MQDSSVTSRFVPLQILKNSLLLSGEMASSILQLRSREDARLYQIVACFTQRSRSIRCQHSLTCAIFRSSEIQKLRKNTHKCLTRVLMVLYYFCNRPAWISEGSEYPLPVIILVIQSKTWKLYGAKYARVIKVIVYAKKTLINMTETTCWMF